MDQSLPRRFGRYLLLRPLGSGGMAEIFLGVSQGMAGFRKVFAIKCLHPHLMRDANLVKLFMDEARLAARLNHGNIVQTFDLGEQDGLFYIAMEYIHGANLAQLLTGGAVPFSVALTIVSEAATGLSFAHGAQDEQGKPLQIVHRDVTPRNIMISFTGEVKLTDFGIARAADQMHTTRTGESKGTLRYMSPEQLEGKKVDSRSDIYSLGVCLFETFTARRLFGGVSNAKLHDPAIRKNLPKPSAVNQEVPSAFDAIVARALAPEPEARYASCAELIEALKTAATAAGVERGREDVAQIMTARFPKQSALPLLSHEDSLVLQHFDGDDPTVHTGPHRRQQRPSENLRDASARRDWGKLPTRARAISSGSAEFESTVTSGQYEAPTIGSIPLSQAQSEPSPRRGRATLMLWVPAIILLLAGVAIAAVVFWPEAQPTPPVKAAKLPARPQEVALKIASTPAGALVMVDGLDVGRTPVTLKRTRDPARSVQLMLILDDHIPVRRKVSLAGDAQIEVSMSPKPRAKPPRRYGKRPRIRTKTKVATVETQPTGPAKTPPVKTPRRPRRPDPVKVDDLK